MLGSEHVDYGSFSQGKLGLACACLSVGGDRSSPSLSFKARKEQPNEDALLVKRCDDLYLLAVADAHFGIESSHRLLQRLTEREIPRSRLDLLKLCLDIQRPHEVASSGTTLIVAVLDARSGHLRALATGDSTLASLDQAGWRVHNERNNAYVRLDRLSYPDTWSEIELQLEPGALLVLHTDGVDECHYRQPATSLQPHHMVEIWQGVADGPVEQKVRRFAAALTDAALKGVDGNPGGQDNIALIALMREEGG